MKYNTIEFHPNETPKIRYGIGRVFMNYYETVVGYNPSKNDTVKDIKELQMLCYDTAQTFIQCPPMTRSKNLEIRRKNKQKAITV